VQAWVAARAHSHRG